MSMPIGFVILFLMAIAPVLPWRKAGAELLRDRLEWPAWGCSISCDRSLSWSKGTHPFARALVLRVSQERALCVI